MTTLSPSDAEGPDPTLASLNCKPLAVVWKSLVIVFVFVWGHKEKGHFRVYVHITRWEGQKMRGNQKALEGYDGKR